MEELTHVNQQGEARMVDVSSKRPQKRTARARGFIRLDQSTCELISRNAMKKGDVLAVARIAGIQAAKKTAELIPLAHPLPLTHTEVSVNLSAQGAEVISTVSCLGPTGVEMEALTAVSAALLSIYDMCKAVDKQMAIGEISLISKTKQELDKET